MDDKLETPENFDFPFIPYDIQLEFMKNLYCVIENKQLGIFESPTGTGKSLSIICATIKWLKNHNQNEREKIANTINNLELRKKNINTKNTDWISTQSEEIDLTRQINSLKIEQNKIIEYDEKILKLRSKKNKSTNKKWQIPQNSESDIQNKEKSVEDEEILLNDDNELNSDDNDDENSDEENKFRPTKIYICSRTHSQLSQFIGEIRKSPFSNDIRVASLASRQNYCINSNVLSLKNNSLINERCLDMQKQIKKQIKTDEDGKITKKQKGSNNCKCQFYKPQMIDELKDLALIEIQDVEDLVKNGKELKACPYYASRKAVEDAEIVLVPYNTILHKETREANGINLKNNVVIIDEAHNLLEAMAQMHNNELNYNQLDYGLRQLKCYKERFHTQFSPKNLLCINQLIFVTTKLQQLFDKKVNNDTEIFTIENFVLSAQIDNYNMFKLTEFCKNSRIAQKVRNYAIKCPFEDLNNASKPPKKGIKHFLSSIENKNKKQPSKNVEMQIINNKIIEQAPTNPLLSIILFLKSLTYSYEDGRILLIQNEDKKQCKLRFLLLNPASNFSDIVQQARSVIVAGGTMKPNAEFRDRLYVNSGANPTRIVEFSCDHIIPPENILPIIMTTGLNKKNLLFNFANRASMGNTLKLIIEEVCKKVIGGVVIFFPSYKYENYIWELIKNVSFGRQVFREPKDSGGVENILGKYADAIKKPSSPGALLLSVVGGKLSEGLNFSDDLGRCVIVVGLPYANITAPDLKEKMSYLDKNEGSGAGQKFYENLCMKSVNQCIGRAVRHRNDYATVLLLDERFNRFSNKNNLPGWIKRSLKVCNFQETFENVEKFFINKKKDCSK